MATELQSQLERLQRIHHTHIDPYTTSRKIKLRFLLDPDSWPNGSFNLFSLSDAAIYSLKRLCDLDEDFNRAWDVFHPPSTQIGHLNYTNYRDFQTFAENAHLDEVIELFLDTLSPHVLSQEAIYCLEWLMRTYSIHIHNTQALITSVLPYHETSLFNKVLKVLEIPNVSPWGFLVNLRNSEIPLKRKLLAQACLASPTIIEIISTFIHRFHQIHKKEDKCIDSWYIVTLLEVINLIEEKKMRFPDQMLQNLMISLLSGVQTPEHREMHYGCLTVFLKLSTLKQIPPELIKQVLLILFNDLNNESLNSKQYIDALAFTAIVCQYQTATFQFPLKLLKIFIRQPDFDISIHKITSERKIEASNFFAVFFRSCFAYLLKSSKKDHQKADTQVHPINFQSEMLMMISSLLRPQEKIYNYNDIQIALPETCVYVMLLELFDAFHTFYTNYQTNLLSKTLQERFFEGCKTLLKLCEEFYPNVLGNAIGFTIELLKTNNSPTTPFYKFISCEITNFDEIESKSDLSQTSLGTLVLVYNAFKGKNEFNGNSHINLYLDYFNKMDPSELLTISATPIFSTITELILETLNQHNIEQIIKILDTEKFWMTLQPAVAIEKLGKTFNRYFDYSMNGLTNLEDITIPNEYLGNIILSTIYRNSALKTLLPKILGAYKIVINATQDMEIIRVIHWIISPLMFCIMCESTPELTNSAVNTKIDELFEVFSTKLSHPIHTSHMELGDKLAYMINSDSPILKELKDTSIRNYPLVLSSEIGGLILYSQFYNLLIKQMLDGQDLHENIELPLREVRDKHLYLTSLYNQGTQLGNKDVLSITILSNIACTVAQNLSITSKPTKSLCKSPVFNTLLDMLFTNLEHKSQIIISITKTFQADLLTLLAQISEITCQTLSKLKDNRISSDFQVLDNSSHIHSQSRYIIVTEVCNGMTLIDALVKTPNFKKFLEKNKTNGLTTLYAIAMSFMPGLFSKEKPLRSASLNTISTLYHAIKQAFITPEINLTLLAEHFHHLNYFKDTQSHTFFNKFLKFTSFMKFFEDIYDDRLEIEMDDGIFEYKLRSIFQNKTDAALHFIICMSLLNAPQQEQFSVYIHPLILEIETNSIETIFELMSHWLVTIYTNLKHYEGSQINEIFPPIISDIWKICPKLYNRLTNKTTISPSIYSLLNTTLLPLLHYVFSTKPQLNIKLINEMKCVLLSQIFTLTVQLNSSSFKSNTERAEVLTILFKYMSSNTPKTQLLIPEPQSISISTDSLVLLLKQLPLSTKDLSSMHLLITDFISLYLSFNKQEILVSEMYIVLVKTFHNLEKDLVDICLHGGEGTLDDSDTLVSSTLKTLSHCIVLIIQQLYGKWTQADIYTAMEVYSPCLIPDISRVKFLDIDMLISHLKISTAFMLISWESLNDVASDTQTERLLIVNMCENLFNLVCKLLNTCAIHSPKSMVSSFGRLHFLNHLKQFYESLSILTSNNKLSDEGLLLNIATAILLPIWSTHFGKPPLTDEDVGIDIQDFANNFFELFTTSHAFPITLSTIIFASNISQPPADQTEIGKAKQLDKFLTDHHTQSTKFRELLLKNSTGQSIESLSLLLRIQICQILHNVRTYQQNENIELDLTLEQLLDGLSIPNYILKWFNKYSYPNMNKQEDYENASLVSSLYDTLNLLESFLLSEPFESAIGNLLQIKETQGFMQIIDTLLVMKQLVSRIKKIYKAYYKSSAPKYIWTLISSKLESTFNCVQRHLGDISLNINLALAWFGIEQLDETPTNTLPDLDNSELKMLSSYIFLLCNSIRQIDNNTVYPLNTSATKIDSKATKRKAIQENSTSSSSTIKKNVDIQSSRLLLNRTLHIICNHFLTSETFQLYFKLKTHLWDYLVNLCLHTSSSLPEPFMRETIPTIHYQVTYALKEIESNRAKPQDIPYNDENLYRETQLALQSTRLMIGLSTQAKLVLTSSFNKLLEGSIRLISSLTNIEANPSADNQLYTIIRNSHLSHAFDLHNISGFTPIEDVGAKLSVQSVLDSYVSENIQRINIPILSIISLLENMSNFFTHALTRLIKLIILNPFLYIYVHSINHCPTTYLKELPHSLAKNNIENQDLETLSTKNISKVLQNVHIPSKNCLEISYNILLCLAAKPKLTHLLNSIHSLLKSFHKQPENLTQNDVGVIFPLSRTIELFSATLQSRDKTVLQNSKNLVSQMILGVLEIFKNTNTIMVNQITDMNLSKIEESKLLTTTIYGGSFFEIHTELYIGELSSDQARFEFDLANTTPFFGHFGLGIIESEFAKLVRNWCSKLDMPQSKSLLKSILEYFSPNETSNDTLLDLTKSDNENPSDQSPISIIGGRRLILLTYLSFFNEFGEVGGVEACFSDIIPELKSCLQLACKNALEQSLQVKEAIKNDQSIQSKKRAALDRKLSWFWYELGIPTLLCFKKCLSQWDTSLHGGLPEAVLDDLLEPLLSCLEVMMVLPKLESNNTKPEKNLSSNWQKLTISCTIELFRACLSDTIAMERITESLMNRAKQNNSILKCTVLTTLQAAWDQLEIAMSGTLHITNPIMSDLVEDSNENVERLTRLLVKTMERVTGTSLNSQIY